MKFEPHIAYTDHGMTFEDIVCDLATAYRFCYLCVFSNPDPRPNRATAQWQRIR